MKKILFAILLLLGGLAMLSVNSSTSRIQSPEPAIESPSVGLSEIGPSDNINIETPADTPEPTPEPPQEEIYTISLGGNCLLGQLHEWGAVKNSFVDIVKENYSYPFSNIKEFFGKDDFTLVNLGNAFTDGSTPTAKQFKFKADPKYAQILKEGSIECVCLANSHTIDYGEKGYKDTIAAVEAKGVKYTDGDTPIVYECPRGLKVGVVSFNEVESGQKLETLVQKAIEQLGGLEADVKIVYMNCGVNSAAEPSQLIMTQARAMVDAGADIIVGSHSKAPHPIEFYNGKVIIYSLANLCYGGHTNPDNKDTAIIQQKVIVSGAGEVKLGDTIIMPCSLSGKTDSNDYCPVLYAEGGEEYKRVLQMLKVS